MCTLICHETQRLSSSLVNHEPYSLVNLSKNHVRSSSRHFGELGMRLEYLRSISNKPTGVINRQTLLVTS